MKIQLIPIICFFTLFVFAADGLWGQSNRARRCGTDEILADLKKNDPSLVQQMERNEQSYVKYISTAKPETAIREACQVYTIPIVVHVIYNDEQSNIPDDQINSQLEVLNEDYRRLPNTAGFGKGVDMGIQFCLASLDPNGNPTNGITRTFSELAAHNTTRDRDLKDLISWNTSQYLNIWVVSSLEQTFNGETEEILGYTFLPGTISKAYEGVVISNINFGKGGSAIAPFNKGRTLTHEIGHYLGLIHTFEGGCAGNQLQTCLSQGDRVCDTPSEQQPKYGCPNTSNSCTEEGCDDSDPIRNYMNYVDDECMDEFTLGQRERVHFFMEDPGFSLNQIASTSNLIATGCIDSPVLASPPQVAFTADRLDICPGNIITFSNEISGCVDEISWNFEGGSPSSSTENEPEVRYDQPGVYTVSLTVSSNGEISTLEKQNSIQVIGNSNFPPLSEDFEAADIPNEWKSESSLADGGWNISSEAKSEGDFSAFVANFGRSTGCSVERLISPVIDLSQSSSASVSFDYAYQSAGSSLNRVDSFKVEIFTGCDPSPTSLFAQGGFIISTVQGSNNNSPFIPSSNEWRNLTLSLDDYLGERELRISFTFLGKGGQNFYLDDVQIVTEPVSIAEEIALNSAIKIYPNPFQREFNVATSFDLAASLTLELFSVNGLSLWSKEYYELPPGEHILKWDSDLTGKLSPGIYFFKIKKEEVGIVKKLIKLP